MDDLCFYMLGSCNTVYDAALRFDLDEDRVSEILIENEIECCSGCGWWHESYELTDTSELLCDGCLEGSNGGG